MKKIFATSMLLVLLIVAAVPAGAQTRRNRSRNTSYATQQQQRRYDRTRYDNSRNVYYDQYEDNRSIWDKHRDKITTAGGALAGAVLGGVIGGKKGAIIGAIAGGGGAAVYTYKIRNKDRRY
ncbi:MAG: hypothetical protein WBP93_14780 [Pyrinomonadaceae bacterium]